MKVSDKTELLKKAGDLDSLLGIRKICFTEGRAKGVEAFECRNGLGLEALVLADRGLDIASLSYHGKNLSLLTKGGICSPFSYTYLGDGSECFLRQFAGGFLTTCGMTFAGTACEEEGRQLPLHGLVSNTPAENIGAYCMEEDGEIVLKIHGCVREARLFGENMLLRREMVIHTERNEICLHDRIENQGFRKEPLMMIYHVNFGYPLLDAGTRVYFSTEEVRPREEYGQEKQERYHLMEEPEDSRPEECYFHTGDSGPESFAMLYNSGSKTAVVIHYRAAECPILCQWKSMQSGDYALGLEPTTCGVQGRVYARENHLLKYLEPQEHYDIHLRFEILEEEEEILEYAGRCKEFRRN